MRVSSSFRRTLAAEVLPVVLSALREVFPDQELEAREIPVNDIVISVPARHLVRAVHVLIEQLGMAHLSTITGDDGGDHIRLLYHFWDGCGVTLETSLPAVAPQIETLTDLIPGAAFYEREIYEMFGVVFEGHRGLRPLLLPEDWTAGPPLLRSSNVGTESSR